MAKKLKESGRKSYNSPPKTCPQPADFRGFPELMAYVRAEYRRRMEVCRNWKKKKD